MSTKANPRLHGAAIWLERVCLAVGWTAFASAVLAWCSFLLASQGWSPLYENLWTAAVLGPTAFALGVLACLLWAVAARRNEAGPVANRGAHLVSGRWVFRLSVPLCPSSGQSEGSPSSTTIHRFERDAATRSVAHMPLMKIASITTK
jgi:hypothetical protein